MAKVGWIDSDTFDAHSNGRNHPECPERLHAIRDKIYASTLSSTLITHSASPVCDSLLARIHTDNHIKQVYETSSRGGGSFDGDTACTPESWEAAVHAAGAVVEAVNQVLNGHWDRAFCSVRPPGHHATQDKVMGFCLFNNIALGAESALQHPDIRRVAILDWDVHHGNGTQDIFYERDDVMFASIHQYPHYPGSGSSSERGRGRGEELTINCPLPAGSGDALFIQAWRETIMPAFDKFDPDLIMVSAGFDADARDPLGGLRISPAGFERLTDEVVTSALSWCKGRVISSLEGGYDVHALAEDVAVHLDALIG